MYSPWNQSFIKEKNPSIEFLELFALTARVLNWCERFANKRIIIFCDNQSVVQMVNNSSAKCKNCMVLIRILVLQGLIHNVCIFAQHMRGLANDLADSLSRGDLRRFHTLAVSKNLKFCKFDTKVPQSIWPPEKF